MKLDDYLSRNAIPGKTFAQTIGTTPVNVSRYRNGKLKPPEDIMRRIFAATNGLVTPNDFYDLPEPPVLLSNTESPVTP